MIVQLTNREAIIIVLFTLLSGSAVISLEPKSHVFGKTLRLFTTASSYQHLKIVVVCNGRRVSRVKRDGHCSLAKKKIRDI